MNQILFVATVFEDLDISISTRDSANIKVLPKNATLSGQLTSPMNSTERANRRMRRLNMFYEEKESASINLPEFS